MSRRVEVARTIAAASLVVLACAPSALAIGRPPLPGEYFKSWTELSALTTAELATMQIQVRTWQSAVGPLLLVPVGDQSNPRELFYQGGIRWVGNDGAELMTAAVSIDELMLVISGLHKSVVDVVGDPAGRPLAFLMVLVREPFPRVFQADLSRAEAWRVLSKLREILAGNAEASAVLERHSRLLGMREAVAAAPKGKPQQAPTLGTDAPTTDVTTSVSIRFSGLRRDADSDEFATEVTLRNTSARTVPAPLSLVLTGPRDIEIPLDAPGRAGEMVDGRLYPAVAVPAPAKGIAPGEEVRVPLRLTNEYEKPFVPSLRVVSRAAKP